MTDRWLYHFAEEACSTPKVYSTVICFILFVYLVLLVSKLVASSKLSSFDLLHNTFTKRYTLFQLVELNDKFKIDECEQSIIRPFVFPYF